MSLGCHAIISCFTLHKIDCFLSSNKDPTCTFLFLTLNTSLSNRPMHIKILLVDIHMVFLSPTKAPTSLEPLHTLQVILTSSFIHAHSTLPRKTLNAYFNKGHQGSATRQKHLKRKKWTLKPALISAEWGPRRGHKKSQRKPDIAKVGPKTG